MNARCGLEDCDCGKDIEKLRKALLRSAVTHYHALHGHPELFVGCKRPRCVEMHAVLVETA